MPTEKIKKRYGGKAKKKKEAYLESWQSLSVLYIFTRKCYQTGEESHDYYVYANMCLRVSAFIDLHTYGLFFKCVCV